MKVIWKGSLSFGLVNIPIEIYSAIAAHSLGFKLLHEKCKTPINYQRWCPHCKQVVEWHDVVKGIKLADGSYFILTQENLKKLHPGKSDYIDIVEFVDTDMVEPIYFDQHYYVVPGKTGEKVYMLFVAALKKAHKSAIGRFVLRDREYVCAIQPYKNGLLLTTLNYQYEIRTLDKLDKLEMPKFKTQELNLAMQLIEKLTKKSLDMQQFKDRFAESVKEKLKQKAKAVKLPKLKKEAVTTTPTLMKALRESLKHVENIRPTKRHKKSLKNIKIQPQLEEAREGLNR